MADADHGIDLNLAMAEFIADLTAEELENCFGNWCEHCGGSGETECYCGGDFCICDNYGVAVCPYCEGGP